MLKEAHAILGYYPAAEGLDLEVQKLGDGGYRSLNVVIVNASAKLAEGHSPEEDLVKEPAPGAWFLTGPGCHQELVGEVVRGRHGGHGGIATAADIRDYLPHTYGDAVVVLQRHGCVVASWHEDIYRGMVSVLAQFPNQGPESVVQPQVPIRLEVVKNLGDVTLFILGGVVA